MLECGLLSVEPHDVRVVDLGEVLGFGAVDGFPQHFAQNLRGRGEPGGEPVVHCGTRLYQVGITQRFMSLGVTPFQLSTSFENSL